MTDERQQNTDVEGNATGNGPTVESSTAEIEEADIGLRIQEIERIFSIVEEAFETDALDSDQTNQLITILERAMANPADTNPEMMAEFVSMLEELIFDPSDLESSDIDGLLSVFEQALMGAAGDDQQTDDVLSVVQAAVRDPTSVTPEDVERFRSGIESTILDMTDPTGGFGQFFGLSGMDMGAEEMGVEEMGDDEFDTFRIARLAAGMTQRATGYSMESGLRTGTRMAYAAMNSESPSELLTEARAITLDELRRSGINIGEDQTEWLEQHEDDLVDERPMTKEELQKKGERLLSQSAEVGRDEAFHPAYPSVLKELSADEARILRLLAAEGIQACMDVYDRHFIPFNAQLVARNLSMVGSDAGCRHPERTPIYLQNLDRLGLIRFSDEPVENLKRYQVLDAQPHIEAAIEKAKRPKTQYGSIQLTEMGIDFCEACLPIEINHERQRRRFRGEPPEEDT